MQVVILGCGDLGSLVAQRLLAAGDTVVGVRRHPTGAEPCPMLAADIGDAGLWQRLPQSDAVLLCANPGIRRGRDNGLAQAAALVPPGTRLVYTGSTAVYADLGGAGADESAPLLDDAASRGLLAIEQAVLAHPGSLVLRVTALVGPAREFASARIRAAAGGTLAIKGDPDRPFSWLYDADCADLCALALADTAWSGLWNAAAPGRLSVRDYYQRLARRAGVAVEVVGDGTTAPCRWIDASRLHRRLPGRTWLEP